LGEFKLSCLFRLFIIVILFIILRILINLALRGPFGAELQPTLQMRVYKAVKVGGYVGEHKRRKKETEERDEHNNDGSE
jgi:hypothetical protein